MTVGHVAFAVLAWNMLTFKGAELHGPTLFRRSAAAGGAG
jgi:hypothetical protein